MISRAPLGKSSACLVMTSIMASILAAMPIGSALAEDPHSPAENDAASSSTASPNRCGAKVGNDDTIGGRTGPPGSPMIDSHATATPRIANNPPCGPR